MKFPYSFNEILISSTNSKQKGVYEKKKLRDSRIELSKRFDQSK